MKMRLSEMVLDFDFYPRSKVDSTYVTYLCEALEAGDQLPPIIVDAASKRIVDGFHRYRALQRLHGPDHQAEVIQKKYKTDQEIFLAAVAANATHGHRLSPYDQAHTVVRAERLQITPKILAAALHLSPEKLVRITVVKTARSAHGPVAIKATVIHKAGKRLTRKQVKAMEKIGGMKALYYVNQIILLVENDLLDTEDGRLMHRLDDLRGLLSGLPAAAVEVA